MGINKNLVFITISIACLMFSLLVESTRNTLSLAPEAQPSLSPQSQPLEKQSTLQVYEDIVRKDIEIIKEKFPAISNVEKCFEFLPCNSHIPRACIKPCARAYTSVTNGLKKADDVGATDFKSINEDYDSFSVDISVCQKCLDLDQNHGDTSALRSMKFLNNKLKNDVLDWLITLQYAF